MSTEHQDLFVAFAVTSFVMPILLGGILVWFIVTYQRRKYQHETERKDALLREQALRIEKQDAVEQERTRIAAEMHDDLGAGLTTIRFLSDKAVRQAANPDDASEIRRIADHSRSLVRNMSEIIWAMNARYDSTENLTGYLRRYAVEYLEEHGIDLSFRADVASGDLPISGEKRRNLFLVYKEALHNAVKYSGAGRLAIEVAASDRYTVRITEKGGKGFDPALAAEAGNGLYNMRKRMTAIGGEIDFQRTPDGMDITISSAPL